MDNIFILNPTIDQLDIKDAIDERIAKLQAITSCLLVSDFAESEPAGRSFCNIIWIIHDFVEELAKLLEKAENLSLIQRHKNRYDD
jgi:hypothetical protein